MAITAAMPGSTGLLPFQERFPDRYVDVGIAEQHAVTAAAGMAMGGLRPVVAIYSTFLSRAFDQANLDVGLHGQPVVLCLDRAGITGDERTVATTACSTWPCCSKVPGMTIFAPSSAQELEVMLRDALELCDGPAAIRYPRGAAPTGADGRGRRRARCPAGCARATTSASSAVGKLVEAPLDAAALLAADGIEATVWDVRVVKPLDPDDARRRRPPPAGRHRGGRHPHRRRRHGRRRAPSSRSAAGHGLRRSVNLGTPPPFIPHGKPAQILANLGLDGPGIAAAVVKALAPARTS